MDPTTSTAAASTTGINPKKQPKAGKMAKDMTLDKRKIESKKRAGHRVASKNHVLAACLNEERRQDN
jgi:hypothetical protein